MAAEVVAEEKMDLLQKVGTEIKQYLAELNTPVEERIRAARALSIRWGDDPNDAMDAPIRTLVSSNTELINIVKDLVIKSKDYIEGLSGVHTDTDGETMELVINNRRFEDLFLPKEYRSLKGYLGLSDPHPDNIETISGGGVSGRKKRRTRKHRGKKRKQTKRRKPRKSTRKPKRRVKKRKQTKHRRRR